MTEDKAGKKLAEIVDAFSRDEAQHHISYFLLRISLTIPTIWDSAFSSSFFKSENSSFNCSGLLLPSSKNSIGVILKYSQM